MSDTSPEALFNQQRKATFESKTYGCPLSRIEPFSRGIFPFEPRRNDFDSIGDSMGSKIVALQRTCLQFIQHGRRNHHLYTQSPQDLKAVR